MSKELSLGQEKVGIPQREVVDAFIEEVTGNVWPGFKVPVVMYYMEKMLFSNLLGLLQKALSEEDLEKLDTNRVRSLNMILLRDHLRHNAELIRPGIDDNWIDPIFDKLARQFDIPDEMLSGFDDKFDLEDFNPQWAQTLAEPLKLESHKLFFAHAAIVTGPAEEGL